MPAYPVIMQRPQHESGRLGMTLVWSSWASKHVARPIFLRDTNALTGWYRTVLQFVTGMIYSLMLPCGRRFRIARRYAISPYVSGRYPHVMKRLAKAIKPPARQTRRGAQNHCPAMRRGTSCFECPAGMGNKLRHLVMPLTGHMYMST